MQKIKKFSFLFLALVVVMGCNTKNKEDHSASGRRKYFLHLFHGSPNKEDKPGKCPICHMDLTPIKDNSASNENCPKRSTNKIGNITTQNIEKQIIVERKLYRCFDS
jgi:Cu(I)/Ag(I) efflux system membrane fusion protein